jgi:hypothetical protein
MQCQLSSCMLGRTPCSNRLNMLRHNKERGAYGPGTEGAGTRVCGYALKNSGLIVDVIRQRLHVCVKELRVKIRSPQGDGVCRVS